MREAVPGPFHLARRAVPPISSPDAQELPALYEVKDGQPSLVNFKCKAARVVPKVLDRGYLALGKDRFSFQQGR
jgi:hypothetical protein